MKSKAYQKHRQLKKLVLHRYTVITRFFNLYFIEVAKQILFLSEQTNFSASDWLGRNFPTA